MFCEQVICYFTLLPVIHFAWWALILLCTCNLLCVERSAHLLQLHSLKFSLSPVRVNHFVLWSIRLALSVTGIHILLSTTISGKLHHMVECLHIICFTCEVVLVFLARYFTFEGALLVLRQPTSRGEADYLPATNDLSARSISITSKLLLIVEQLR